MMPNIETVIAPRIRWIACMYDGKPRAGLDLGSDPRPGTENLMVRTPDGIRTFRKDKILSLRDVTTFEVSHV